MPPAAYAPYIAIALCFTILTARMVFCWPARDDNRQWGMARPAVPLTNKMKASKIFKAGPRSGESPVKFVRRVKKSFYNARKNAIRKKSGQLKEDNKISNAKNNPKNNPKNNAIRKKSGQLKEDNKISNSIRKKSGQLKEDNKISNAKTSRELIAKKEHCEIAAMAMRNKEPELTQETADAVATELYEGFLDDETGQPLFKFIVRD